jgi:cell shape-determining protein MreD
MGHFQLTKLAVASALELEKDALHIYVGFIVFVLAAIVLRRSMRDWRAVAAVFLVAAAGEIGDFIEVWAAPDAPYWRAHWHDMWNTMLIPTLLFLIARHTRLMK